MNPNINLVEVHPQLNNNRHLMDGVLMGASSLWPLLGIGLSIPTIFSIITGY
jgi:hypothetical protein